MLPIFFKNFSFYINIIDAFAFGITGLFSLGGSCFSPILELIPQFLMRKTTIIPGNVIQSSKDAAYLARHVGIRIGLPTDVPAVTVNRLCGSGFEAIIHGAQVNIQYT